ncbi:MAG: tRNA pseudouridine(55) synthase TruB [Chloroherpetonaceae bacterium]|nr:tRNA pseudouridine(55) synthase TruB [Chloroherpetonaceae bacterium]MCS7211765.1 tRNA pseudouridine(55) synthase TruB [Chloroherpetonaceae bacterium]
MRAVQSSTYLPECESRLLLVDKPLNWTSFDVVAKVRNAYTRAGYRCKVGHSGTLDPKATGLLILATGKATKQLPQLETLDKTYSGTIKLGAKTLSYDSETEEYDHRPLSDLSPECILQTARRFTGKMQQKPPMYSAVWHNGKRLYELARAGEIIEERPSREIEVYEFEVIEIALPLVFFRCRVSKGTYIRALANDFGNALGVGGYLVALRRERIGRFEVSQAQTIEQILADIAPRAQSAESQERQL